MAVVTSRRAHRKPAPLSAIVISKETRQRALAIAGSGAALTMIAGTTGAAMNGGATLDVSESAKSATAAVTANAAVAANDVAWQADSAVAEADAAPAETAVSDESTAPVASTDADAGTSTRAAHGFVAPNGKGSSIVETAKMYVGAAYVFGGTGPTGFDCSGFTQYVYGLHGINLGRTTWAQGSQGVHVSAAQAQPGDIVYYGSHVGIYAGGGMMVDAGNPGTGVIYRPVYGAPSYVRVAG